MRPLVSAVVLLAVTAIVHLIIWRTRRPRGQYTTLMILCGGALAASLASVTLVPLPAGIFRVLPQTLTEYVSFTILYLALALSYISTYSAVQADSPSLSILLRIERAGSAGMSLAELEAEFTDALLVLPRLQDLVSGKLVVKKDERYVIDSRGALLAAAHSAYRALLGVGKGG